MNFKNYKDLIEDVEEFAHKLPKFDLVVGIKRSGMLPATILSLYWHIPLASLEEFIKEDWKHGGHRLGWVKNEVRNVLIIDDTYGSGESMKLTKEKLSELSKKYNIKYGVLYVGNEEGCKNLDYYYMILTGPRGFQWNVFNHGCFTDKGCFDMDGVLCRPPLGDENDYGENYEIFLKNTEPWMQPTRVMGAIITGRLEKYRKQTEEWLSKYNYKYKQLIMRPNKDINISKFKVEWFKKLEWTVLFFEDEIGQAEFIHKQTNKPVLLIKEWRLLNDNKKRL